MHSHVVKFPSTAFLPMTPIMCTRFASLNGVVGNVPLHTIGAVKLTPANINLKGAVHAFLAVIKTKLTNETASNG
jgi:hypothetical protein